MGVLEETEGRIENERGEWGMGLEPLTGRARDDTWAFGLLTGPQVWARIDPVLLSPILCFLSFIYTHTHTTKREKHILMIYEYINKFLSRFHCCVTKPLIPFFASAFSNYCCIGVLLYVKAF